jgi:hypothetical protein
MPRKATGQVIERDGRGRTYALRFRAYGKREFVTLGTPRELDATEGRARAGERPGGRPTWYLAAARPRARGRGATEHTRRFSAHRAR